MIDAESTPPAPRHRSISPAEWSLILEALAEGGPDAAYAVVGRGKTTADGRPSRYRTLDDQRKREPWKSQWDEVERKWLAQFPRILHRLATDPNFSATVITDPKTGRTTVKRDGKTMAWCALHILRRHDESWRESKRLAVQGEVTHDHRHTLGASADQYRLDAGDVMALDDRDQAELFRLLSLVEENRAARATENRNGRVIESRSLPAPETPSGPAPDAGGGS